MGLKCCKRCCCCCTCCCASSGQGKIGIVSDINMAWMLNHTDYDEREIKQLFLGFNLDFPNGGINRKQFERCFTTKNARKMCDVVFRTLDNDGSGLLDLKEFLLAIELVAARTPEEKLLWAFRQYDTDNSGYVDRKEMNNVLKSIYNMLDVIGEAPTDNPSDKAQKVFEEIDINNDGVLNQDEFLRGCMNDPELMGMLEKLFNFLTEGMD